MLYRVGSHAVAEDHVEDAGRHPRTFPGALDRLSAQLGGDHMAAVRLEHDRAASGERGGGIATRGGERQRKLLAPNTATGPSAVRYCRRSGRGRGALRQRAVDTHALDVAAPQQRSEQPHLAAGSGAFAAQPRRRQGGFLHGEGEKASSNASNSSAMASRKFARCSALSCE